MPGIRLFDLHEQVAVITGGARGLGAVIAAGLASAGATTVIVSRNESEATETAEQIQGAWGTTSFAVACDVGSEEGVAALVQQVLARTGRIDILVNSAGINIRGPIHQLSLEQFREVQRTNVEGTWLSCRAVIPHMISRGYGRICNIASALGVVGLA
ncbi:MAG TPA: 2-deoxy-D-gluconate 3-dehydrogenase, partial [Planctomycetaceae bacterium]|nr:2-deoxy-D-gluconate 3-dehydrogenase [Planctomycetaceae bacterium]